MKCFIEKNQGVALLLALVVVAIATTLATNMWFKNQLSVSRANNLFQAYQAKHYSRGLMLWAGDILKKDYEVDENPHDTNADAWHQGVEGIVVENAILSGQLTGMNHKFNVNNLYRNNEVSEVHYQYFIRLLKELEIDISVADKIIDWIDPDSIPRPQGAEDFIYLAKALPHTTGSKPFQHISQLRLIDGLNIDAFNLLSQYVTVLPNNKLTKMNINTIAAVMINALDDRITRQVALSIYQEGKANYTRLDDFFLQQRIRVITAVGDTRINMEQLLDVKTTYLQAESRINMNNSIYKNYALLERANNGESLVLQWSMIPFVK